MRPLRRGVVTVALACLLAPGISELTAARADRTAAQGDALRVFDLSVSGASPFRRFDSLAHSEAVDMATLPNGDIVLLLKRGSPALLRVDQQTRGHELPVPKDIRPQPRNSVVAARDGALLFSDGGRVLRREPDGRLVTFAGSRRPRSASGDGGPAVGAGMAPTGLALLPDGSLLSADRRNHRIRHVDLTGRISTVAGTGEGGSDGDGGPATAAQLAKPSRLAVYPDGSYLIVEEFGYVRVRRVDPTGRITTVFGIGPARSQSCGSTRGPATALRVPSDGFSGAVAALPDGGFLIAAEYLDDDYDPETGGMLRVSADGVVTPVLCAGNTGDRVDGRDLYVSGRAVTDAFAPPPSDLAVTADGSIVLSSGYRSTWLRMLAVPARSQRFAVAVAPGTLESVTGGRVMITATDAATVRLGVYRKRRLLIETVRRVPPGDSVLRLPRRLRSGVHVLRVLATTADGRRATARMTVLGRPRLTVAYAKRRLKREFAESFASDDTGGLSLSDCRRHDPRRVRCRASYYFDYDIAVDEVFSLALRRDGILVFRAQSRGRTFSARAISP